MKKKKWSHSITMGILLVFIVGFFAQYAFYYTFKGSLSNETLEKYNGVCKSNCSPTFDLATPYAIANPTFISPTYKFHISLPTYYRLRSYIAENQSSDLGELRMCLTGTSLCY